METTGDRVRRLIDESGRTQRVFAEQVNMEQSKLSKSLGGTRRFTSLELALIAEALHVTVDWLLTGQEPELATAARRSAGSSAEAALRWARQYAMRRTNLSHLGYPQKPNLPEPVSRSTTWIQQGQALANAATAMLGSRGLSTVGDLPKVIEEVFGIDVAIEQLGAGFDGLAVSTDTTKLILVDATSITARQRFTIAHELGHLLCGDDQGIHEDADIYSSASKKGEGEVRANAFAAALLMPEALVRAMVAEQGSSLEGLSGVAQTLNVSPTALAYRLENLRVIDAGLRTALMGTTSKAAAMKSGRAAEFAAASAASMQRRPPGLLLADALAAYEAGHSTLRVFAEILGVDTQTLRQEWAEGEGR